MTEMYFSNVKLQYSNLYYIICLPFLVAVNCYPIETFDFEVKPDARDEKRYPNGTVVGKYSYTDSEGNPVHVKYYADKQSYGVELNSLKITDNSEAPAIKYNQLDYVLESTESPFTIGDIVGKFNNPVASIKYKNTDELLNKNEKANHFKKVERKSSPDYEIYAQDKKRSNKCGDEKVRVYYNSNNGNRKIRETMYQDDDVSKFCNIFD